VIGILLELATLYEMRMFVIWLHCDRYIKTALFCSTVAAAEMAKFCYRLYKIKDHVRITKIVRRADIVDGCSRLFDSCGAMRLEKQTSTLN